MSTHTRKTRLSRNFIANMSSFAFVVILSFFMSPFVVQKLGPTGYGVWSLVTGLLGYLALLIPGFAVESVLNIMLGIALIRPFGVIGVAIGTLIPSVLVTLGYMPYCLRRAAKIPKYVLYKNVILLPVLSCIPFAVGAAFVERFFPATNLVTFFAQIVIILPLVPATAWLLCFSTSEKRRVTEEIASVFK